MSPRFSALSFREKLFFLVLSVFLLYIFIVRPVLASYADARSEWAHNSILLHHLNVASSVVYKAEVNGYKYSLPRALLPGIEKSIVESGISEYVVNTKQSSANITIQFSNVPFGLLSEWIQRIDSKIGCRVSSLSLTKKSEGVVSGSVTMR